MRLASISIVLSGALGLGLAVFGGLFSSLENPEFDRELELEIHQLDARAREAWFAKETDAAREHLREMARLDPEHPLVYDSYRNLRLAPGTPDGARRFLESLGSLGPGRSFLAGHLTLHGGGEQRGRAGLARNYENSVAAFREALVGYRAAHHVVGQAHSRYRIGFALHRLVEQLEDPEQGRVLLDEAERELRAAGESFRKLGDDSRLGDVLSNLGRVAVRRGRLEDALEWQRQAILVLERAEDREGEAIVQIGMARVERRLGHFERERDAWRRAVKLARGATLAESLAESALAEVGLQDCRNAIVSATQAVEVAESLGRNQRAAKTRLGLAFVLAECGRPEAALEALRPVPDQLPESDHASRAQRLYLEGRARVDLGQWSVGRGLLAQARQRARELDLPDLEATVLNALGRCDWAAGRLGAALAEQQQALSLDRRNRDARSEILRLANLGVVHWALGRPDVAERHLRAAVSRGQAEGSSRDLALPLENLALVLEHDGRIAEGLEAARQAFAIRSEGSAEARTASTRLILGRLLLRDGRFAESHAEAEAALTVFLEHSDRNGRAEALRLSADVFAREDRVPEALALYDEVIGLERELADVHDPIWAHVGRAAILQKLGRSAEALSAYDQALGLLEAQRVRLGPADFRVRFVGQNAGIYESAVDLAARLDPDDGAARAFALAERARARGLADLLAESVDAYEQGLDPEFVERRLSARDALAAAASGLDRAATDAERDRARLELDAAESALLALAFEIRGSSRAYADLVYPEPATLPEVERDLLRPGETLLTYFLGSEHAWLWRIDRGRARLHQLPAPREIEALLERFRDETAQVGATIAGERLGLETAEALSLALLPGEPLPPGERLFIVPYGPLHTLPFEALRREGRFLVEDHEVLVVPSATTLRLLRRRGTPVATGGFFGLGDPVVPVALDEAAGEITEIAELFPPSERRTLVGSHLTRAAIRAAQFEGFRYVHFATHGRSDAIDPRRLGLVLGGSTEDGTAELLRPEDVLGLRLSADVVVLSACESGLGAAVRGEGLLGLTRAFLYAGARSVVVTLWPVEDRSTAEFMRAFYGELRAGRPAPEALRRAKLAFLGSERPAWRRPSRWAPFVLVGDPLVEGLNLPAPPPTH